MHLRMGGLLTVVFLLSFHGPILLLLHSLLLYIFTVATCPDLGNTIENGIVSYTRDPTEQGLYVEGTTVTVSCDDDYSGGGDITCQNDGNWSSKQPTCI